MKHLLSSILFILGIHPMFSQSSHLIGAETSIQFTNINATNSYNRYNYRIGIGAGLTYTYELPKLLAFSTGVLYNPHGFSFTVFETDETGNVTAEKNYIHSFDYISIPLKTSLRFGSNKLKGFASVGLIASFMVNERENYKFSFGYFEKNTLDLGILLEAGMSYDLSQNFQLSLAARWQQNLIGTATDFYPYTRIFSNGIGATLALKYRLH